MIGRLDARPLVRLLAIAMTVADLAGRAKVLDEVSVATGRSVRPKTGLSFADGELLAPESVEPTAALDFFRQKIAMTRPAFDRLERRYRESAFTIANVESVAVVERIQGIVGEVVAEGQTAAEFRKRAELAMQAAGVSPANPFHLETVFANAVNSAYQIGRVHQMLQADVRRALPFWQYRTVGDDRVRPNHRKLHRFTARFDDAVWRRITPPNGHRCRCSLVALTRRQAGEAEPRLSTPGSRRLPAQPDEGWDSSPAAVLLERIKEGRRQ